MPVRFDDRAPFQTKDVALLDFTDGKGGCAPGKTTSTTITGKVPVGDYSRDRVRERGARVDQPPKHRGREAAAPGCEHVLGLAERISLHHRRDAATALPEPEADAGVDPSGGASFVHIGSGGCTGANTTGFTCARANRTSIKLSDFDPETDTVVARSRQGVRGREPRDRGRVPWPVAGVRRALQRARARARHRRVGRRARGLPSRVVLCWSGCALSAFSCASRCWLARCWLAATMTPHAMIRAMAMVLITNTITSMRTPAAANRRPTSTRRHHRPTAA